MNTELPDAEDAKVPQRTQKETIEVFFVSLASSAYLLRPLRPAVRIPGARA